MKLNQKINGGFSVLTAGTLEQKIYCQWIHGLTQNMGFLNQRVVISVVLVTTCLLFYMKYPRVNIVTHVERYRDRRPVDATDDIQGLDQHDVHLTEYIANYVMWPPSSLPLKLDRPWTKDHSQVNQSRRVDELLAGKENGFFVESGAVDGEIFSNTLFFETARKWTGVLIEAEPAAFDKLVKKHRNAYIANACLSPTTKAITIPFRIGGVIGGLSNYMSDQHVKRMNNELGSKKEVISIQCFPMFSMLQAIGVTHVDFFSLDIEGAEPEVLKTLPLDKMTVDVFCVEHNGDKNKRNSIYDLLVKKHGYVVVHEDNQDIILKRKGM